MTTILVLGNLMLDMIAPVDEAYLRSYDLLPDTIQTVEDKHLLIYDEVSQRPNVTFSPGGSALNTVRMIQRILNTPNVITFVGAVGSDSTGNMLIGKLKSEGIQLKVQVIDNAPTARCASLLTRGGASRTMVTDLGAALKFSHDVFLNSDYLKMMKTVTHVYITGYFLKVSVPTVMDIVKYAHDEDIPIILNLNAVWVTTVCKDALINLLPYVDILFGNATELLSFGEQLGLECNVIAEVAMLIGAHAKLNPKRQRLVIVTRGEQSVLTVQGSQKHEYPVTLVTPDCLVDTTGAGDAFVGGFLAGYVKNQPVSTCIKCAIWVATEEIKDYGFILPQDIPFDFGQFQDDELI